MPIIRKFAVQGHSVPSRAYSPRGLEGSIDDGVMSKPLLSIEDNHSDSLHVGLDNVRFFKCKDCYEILLENDLDLHDCDDEIG